MSGDKFYYNYPEGKSLSRLAYILVCCFVFTINAQSPMLKPETNKDPFQLNISTYNHAERIFKGTLQYKLTNSKLTISRTVIFSNASSVLLSKKVDSVAVQKIKNIDLKNVEDYYFNYCVMATSGTEYGILINDGLVKKEISLHHYYHPQIEKLMTEVDKLLPDSLKINYLSSDTKQDCK